ncbi:MAG: alpha/beta hydrolase [Pseudomonadota bacterium]
MRHRAGRGGSPSWLPELLGLFLLLVLLLAPAARAADFAEALGRLEAHYAERLPGAAFTPVAEAVDDCGDAHYLRTDALRRPAAGPLVFDHGEVRKDAILLFHGLSDSPWFMCGIAQRLHDAGANVVVALLTGHGRTEPFPEVHRDDLIGAWEEDARAALAFARTRGDRVSIGGMSLGGVLAVRTWTLAPADVSGGVMLFSAAFDFSLGLQLAAGCVGTAEERRAWWAVARRACHAFLTRATRWWERDVAWQTGNPYRNFFSAYAALRLGELRRETLAALDARPLDAPLLVAHSAADIVSPIAGVEGLIAGHLHPDRVSRVTIDDERPENCRVLQSDCVRPAPVVAACGLPHASLTLAVPIREALSGAVCEVANPRFDTVADAAVAFVRALPPPAVP